MLRSYVFRIALSDQKSRRYGVAAENEQAAREIVRDEFKSRGEKGYSIVDVQPATPQEAASLNFSTIGIKPLN
jgi:hypothetical protein